MKEKTVIATSATLPMIAMRGLVLFPKMVLHFDIGRDKSIAALNSASDGERRVFLSAQKELDNDDPKLADIYPVGVVAEIKQVIKIPNSGLRVMVEGLYRAKLVSVTQQDPFLMAQVKPFPTKKLPASSADMTTAMMRTVKALFDKYADLSPKMPKEIMLGVLLADDPAMLAEFVAGNIPLPVDEKQEILAESNILTRLEILAEILENENEILFLERDIYERVKGSIDQNQREYYLREQIKILSEELGDDDSPENEVEQYLTKIKALKLSEEANDKLTKEANRLLKMPSSSHEAGVVRGYLDVCLELPWNKTTKIKSDVAEAQRVLDKDHYGMKKVKERIVESIAVRALAPDIKGQILCLIGPPGVGKTSIAKSIAKATGREYVRLSLGGVRDESDIRGHRKTYIGSMPGRIIDALKRAKSRNPLMLLDEVDKLGTDSRGDPASALLEVLDSEQNHAFRDHFVELPFDLSQVLFVATANNADTIPAPLYDRMEIIELPSYTRVEKLNIAKNHLIPKQRVRHGLSGQQLRFSEEAVYTMIDSYTREAGVRKLEQVCASVMRKSATKIVAGEAKRISLTSELLVDLLGPKRHQPDGLLLNDEIGVANGLAWTSVGGEILQIEVAIMDGTGKLELTGSLGAVMKESAQAAVSYLRSHSDLYALNHEFYKTKDIHIHFPEGAVPKDGPSAGIAICTALLSALTGICIHRDVAMTGEMTLRGRVLAIGGLREKTMAAYRAGVKTVIIPAENEPDLADLDPLVKNAITFVPVHTIDAALSIALLSLPTAQKDEFKPKPNLLQPEIATRQPVTC